MNWRVRVLANRYYTLLPAPQPTGLAVMISWATVDPRRPFWWGLMQIRPPPPGAGEAALPQICICKLIGGFGTCLATRTLVTIPLLSIGFQKKLKILNIQKNQKNWGCTVAEGGLHDAASSKTYCAILCNVAQYYACFFGQQCETETPKPQKKIPPVIPRWRNFHSTFVLWTGILCHCFLSYFIFARASVR